MSDYDNSNSGAMFKNDRKLKDNHPDRKGSAQITCPSCKASHDFWVSGWVKTSGPMAKNPGQQFMSMAFQAKEEQQQAKTPPPDEFKDDDMPF